MPRPGRLSVGIAEGICLIPVVRLDFAVVDGPAGQQPSAGQRWRLARKMPPIGKVLGGDGSSEPSASDTAISHDARLQPPEVGLPHDRPAVAHQPRRELRGEAEVEHCREQPAGGTRREVP